MRAAYEASSAYTYTPVVLATADSNAHVFLVPSMDRAIHRSKLESVQSRDRALGLGSDARAVTALLGLSVVNDCRLEICQQADVKSGVSLRTCAVTRLSHTATV